MVNTCVVVGCESGYLQTCQLSPSDGEISPFWLISPRLPVRAQNLPVFAKLSQSPRENSPFSEIFLTNIYHYNISIFFVFCNCVHREILFKINVFTGRLFNNILQVTVMASLNVQFHFSDLNSIGVSYLHRILPNKPPGVGFGRIYFIYH